MTKDWKDVSEVFEYFFQLVFTSIISEARYMNNLFFLTEVTKIWRPSDGLIYLLLVMGAFLVAGVTLSIFTFYEDCYWSDQSYRKFLKDGKRSSAKV